MSVTRRLTTIFYADVAGYRRLTGADEVGAHQRVMAMLDDVTARISAAGGTVLRYADDAILATFPSVVLAVDTAAEIQNALADGNAARVAGMSRATCGQATGPSKLQRVLCSLAPSWHHRVSSPEADHESAR